ncbi:(4Fe-4S)-binding protein [Streptomyces sp. NPDC058001]|uniref:(4Fe-4S)-binding protein n=1 Tax=Streptomyces sp. NPDC058001 TaxID=3346300 RepID=UPI0036E1BCC2
MSADRPVGHGTRDPAPRPGTDTGRGKAYEGKAYEGQGITVTFDAWRCLHAAECVRGLPRVFDTARRPWIDPDAAPAPEVADVVRRWPSGALQYTLAEGPDESPDAPTIVARASDGRIEVRGDLRIAAPDGTEWTETRVTLCGCGSSARLPLCDHSGACGRET